jgi:uncharacterized protein YndB with AHSA1/START domain
MQQLADACTAVNVTHQYAASPARVFDAWLSPQLAGSWLFATASRPMVSVDIDARAGGAFCFVERRAGAIIEHRGHYDEITRPQRLVFVLHSPDCAPQEVPLGGAPKEVLLGRAPQATRVTVGLTHCDGGCELQLMHDGLSANQAARIETRWTGMLYGLGVVLARHNTGKSI